MGAAELGIATAAVVMHAVASGGGDYSAASTLHINLLGSHAIVAHGIAKQKARWLVLLIRGNKRRAPTSRSRTLV